MSFASEVKAELCAALPEKACCRKAMLYGMLLYGRSFGERSILLQSEHPVVVRTAVMLLGSLNIPGTFDGPGAFGVTLSLRASLRAEGRGADTVAVEGEEAARLYAAFGCAPGEVSLRLNRANIENECCVPAFVRGVFLTCGSIVEPEKDYHLEFVTPHYNRMNDFSSFLGELGFAPKTLRRKGNFVVYFKESSQIEDLLTFIGAPGQSLELMNVKIYKDLRNKANRLTNCETANIGKTVDAAASQVAAIRRLIAEGRFARLPDELRAVAELRLQNPEMSLRELGEALHISRSGVDHRLRRIREAAEEP